MFIKSQCELIYVGQETATNGSPIEVEEKVTIPVSELETFSVNYYNEQDRSMRESRNLVIPTYLTNDVHANGKNYELMYVNYQGKRYKVRNILKRRKTRQMMILDIQEVK